MFVSSRFAPADQIEFDALGIQFVSLREGVDFRARIAMLHAQGRS